MAMWFHGYGLLFAIMSYSLGFLAIFFRISRDENLMLLFSALASTYYTAIWISFIGSGQVTTGAGWYLIMALWCFGAFFFGILEQGMLHGEITAT